MKKVVDWTFGSIFRTFGRIIAYLIFGIAISYILSSLDFRISDLFLDNVKADTFERAFWQISWNDGGGSQLPENGGNFQYFSLPTTGTSINTKVIQLSTTMTKTSEHDYVKIPFLITGTDSTNIITDQKYYFCSYHNIDGYSIPDDCGYEKSGYGYQTININMKFSINLYDGNNQSPCTLENDILKCYLQPNVTYNKLYIQYSVSNDNIGNLYMNIGHAWAYFLDSQNAMVDNQQTIINQQNQNTQQIIEQQQNSTQQMLDSNTTQAESDAEGFFGDFDVPDVGGLSAIITAPLSTIRSLLSSSCSELVLPLPYVDEDLRLPCMNSIYTEHFGLFFSLYQTIILAIIAYRCIRSIYFDITGFTNPDDDRIEVMDL